MASQLLVLLTVATTEVGANFLKGFKVDTNTLNRLAPVQVDSSKIAQVSLPPAIKSPVEIAQAVQENREGLQRQAQQMVGARQTVLELGLDRGASIASGITSQDLSNVLSSVTGSQVASQAQKTVTATDTLSTSTPEAIAAALRGATSQAAEVLNQTSLNVADAMRSVGPRAAALLNSTGYHVADKLASQKAPSMEDLPSIELPSLDLSPGSPVRACAAVFVAALIVITAASGGAFLWVSRRTRRGPMLLSEALAPLSEPSARAPKLQAAAASPPREALLQS